MPQMVVPKSSRGQGGPNEAPGGVLEAKVSYLSAKIQSSIKMLILQRVFEGRCHPTRQITSKTARRQRQHSGAQIKAPLPIRRVRLKGMDTELCCFSSA